MGFLLLRDGIQTLRWGSRELGWKSMLPLFASRADLKLLALYFYLFEVEWAASISVSDAACLGVSALGSNC
jgi:hypothetical protein